MSEDINRTAAALTAALMTFEQGSRQSGRTERMIAQLKPGHRVICSSDREANRLRRILHQRGISEVTIVAADPTKAPLPHHTGLASRRMPTTVDHSWVLERFRTAIEDEQRRIWLEIGHISGVELGMPVWPDTFPPAKSDPPLAALFDRPRPRKQRP